MLFGEGDTSPGDVYKRQPLYRAAADIVVDGGAPAIVVAKRVAQLFQ